MKGKGRKVYDSRFIAAIYYPKNDEEKAHIRHELVATLARYISSVTVYEIYKLTVQGEGREAAELRVGLLRKDFRIVDVDWDIARSAAHIWAKYRVPMADAIVAATALRMKVPCVSNDPHLLAMREIRTHWV